MTWLFAILSFLAGAGLTWVKMVHTETRAYAVESADEGDLRRE